MVAWGVSSEGETREKLAELLRDMCPIAALIRKKTQKKRPDPVKPCPFYGPGGTCAGCTYSFEATAAIGIELVKKALGHKSEARAKRRLDEQRQVREGTIRQCEGTKGPERCPRAARMVSTTGLELRLCKACAKKNTALAFVAMTAAERQSPATAL